MDTGRWSRYTTNCCPTSRPWPNPHPSRCMTRQWFDRRRQAWPTKAGPQERGLRALTCDGAASATDDIGIELGIVIIGAADARIDRAVLFQSDANRAFGGAEVVTTRSAVTRRRDIETGQ